MRPHSVCFPVGYRRVAPERPGEGNRPYKACGKFPANRVVARFDLRYTRGEQWEGMLIDYLKVRPIEYTGHQRSLLPTTEYLICSRASWLDACRTSRCAISSSSTRGFFTCRMRASRSFRKSSCGPVTATSPPPIALDAQWNQCAD